MIVFSDSENTWTDYIVHSGEPYSGSCENCLLKCLQKASSAAVNVGAKYNPWTYECTVITLYDLQYKVTFSDDVLIKRRMDVIYNEPREVVDGSYYWSKLPGELRIGSYVDIYLSSSFDSIRVMFGLVGGNFMSIAARYATSDLVVRCSFNGSQHCTALYQTVPLVLDTMQKFTFQVTTEGFKVARATYTSSQSAEEMQNGVAEVLRNKTDDKLSTSPHVSILLNESCDISVTKKNTKENIDLAMIRPTVDIVLQQLTWLKSTDGPYLTEILSVASVR
ncbi:hypothetical protein ACF0H5_000378 [Mactra antiquata]